MAVLDDVCATMHGQSEGADSKFVQVRQLRSCVHHGMANRPVSSLIRRCAGSQKSEASIGSHPHFTPMSSAFMIKHYAGSVRAFAMSTQIVSGTLTQMRAHACGLAWAGGSGHVRH